MPDCKCASYRHDEPSHATHERPAQGGRYQCPVRDGKFQFTVTSVTSAKSAGDSALGQTAQGQYAVMHMTVTNIADVAQTMNASAPYVDDSQGRKFSVDSTADIYGNGTANSVFMTQIKCGARRWGPGRTGCGHGKRWQLEAARDNARCCPAAILGTTTHRNRF